jgi:hypothetical protein
VPDQKVRHYFFKDEPSKRREMTMLIRRLQEMDVAVYRLNAPLRVPDLKPYLESTACRHRAGGDLLDPDGAAPEAVHPGAR